MKKSTEVIKSPLNGVKLLLAIGLFLGLCLLVILNHSFYSQGAQSLLLAAYALVWALGCVWRVRYLKYKKVR
jgi:uncharacterized membrane protein YqjE